ncbi:NAD(P)-dependent oxidoreductase [Pseudarthrobacter sulfonivorans]|uniref:NAD(P)-dependent oxidoreductase n=1 Tax=Pseudarthrobacter sulfonivorans TaxID=121292 RepID=UPI0027813901|nr:NAD(P)-dependent oxidoreductase [Pseudarthrobacter sulfonivorans]MDQ0000728.1 3-hydroxyisobutyrate dehydrogenase-like beta-hydroxyacid dehydrogenase [Pseudarthrobacter sulfonivorans]
MSNERMTARKAAAAVDLEGSAEPNEGSPDVPGDARIGFIGIGAMGLPMARNLHLAGYPVTAVDPSVRQRELAQDAGIPVGDNVEVLRDSTVVIIMVASPDQLLGLVDNQGLFGGTSQLRTAVVASTVGPRALQEFAERVARHGVEVVDLAVTGGVAGAESGSLTLLTGAPASTIDRVRPILDCLGLIKICGDRPGDGQAVKLVNNLLAAINSAAVAESIRFTKGLGLDPERVLNLIEHGAAASWMLSERGPRMVQPRAERDFGTHTSILAKDTSLIEVVAAENGTAVPLLKIVRAQFAQAIELGWAGEDDSCIVDLPL